MKLLEDLKMESWSDCLSSTVPCLAGTSEQSLADPRFQEEVIVGLQEQFLAGQADLEVLKSSKIKCRQINYATHLDILRSGDNHPQLRPNVHAI